MLSKPEREQIIALIKREVVPAIGCTEPIAVALCVAKAREILGTEPEKVSARLSANILKNAMGVGIPGTGMIGLPIAIALGALVGRSEYQLEVLKDSAISAGGELRRYLAELFPQFFNYFLSFSCRINISSIVIVARTTCESDNSS